MARAIMAAAMTVGLLSVACGPARWSSRTPNEATEAPHNEGLSDYDFESDSVDPELTFGRDFSAVVDLQPTANADRSGTQLDALADEPAVGRSNGQGDDRRAAEPAPGRTLSKVAEPQSKASLGEETVEPAPVRSDRQMIYRAAMTIEVPAVADAVHAAQELAKRSGGWLDSRHDHNDGTSDRTQLVLKIPPAKLEAVMDELGSWGRVVNREMKAEDVTAQYFDLEIRIRVLRETQSKLLALLETAETASEALEIHRALEDVTVRLESLLGQKRMLQSRIDSSVLDLDLREEHDATSTRRGDPFRWVNELGLEAVTWQ